MRSSRAGQLRWALSVTAILAAFSVIPGSAAARPGDVYVADGNADPGAVFRLDPATGAPTLVASRGNLYDQPADVAFAPDGRLLLMDQDAPGAPSFPGTLFGIDLGTGLKSMIVTGGAFETPEGVTIAPDGDALVVDADTPGLPVSEDGGVFRVDLRTGARTIISASPLFEAPVDIAVAPSGEIFVADNRWTNNLGAILRLDAAGVPTPIYAGSNISSPTSVAIRPDGKLLVTTAGTTDQLLLLDPRSGAFARLAVGAPLNQPNGVALGPDGIVYVADGNFTSDSALLRLDPATGGLSALRTGLPFETPRGVTVEPPRCGGRLAMITGSPGRDTLVGSPFADVIAAGGGNDVIKGGKGADRICGEAGKDRIVGGKGKDRCLGGNGRDSGKGCEKGKL